MVLPGPGVGGWFQPAHASTLLQDLPKQLLAIGFATYARYHGHPALRLWWRQRPCVLGKVGMPGMCLGKVAMDEELKTEICGNMYTCIFIFIYLQMYIYLHIYICAYFCVIHLYIYTVYSIHISPTVFWEGKAWGRFKCLKS